MSLDLHEMHKMAAELKKSQIFRRAGIVSHDDHKEKVMDIKNKIDLIPIKEDSELDAFYRKFVDDHHKSI